MIRRNPYVLCEEIDGIGFERADGVAKELGVEENAPCRIEAAVLYVLQFHANSSGHTFLPRDKLVPTVAQLLSVGEEETEEAIDKLIALGKLQGAQKRKAAVHLSDPAILRRKNILPARCNSWKNVRFRRRSPTFQERWR